MGLIKTAAKVAVASSVHGRVQRRQQQRWAAQDAQPLPPPPAPPATPAAVPSPVQPAAAPSSVDRLEQLKLLGELRASGVLTDAEFEQQKAIILAGG